MTEQQQERRFVRAGIITTPQTEPAPAPEPAPQGPHSPHSPFDTRMPPNDLDAERSVLGSMMLVNDVIGDVMEAMRATDHYRPQHEVIHDAIVDLYGRNEPVDRISVADELTKRGDLARVGGEAYLADLTTNVVSAFSAGHHAKIIADHATLRHLVEAGMRIVQMGYGQGEGEVSEIVNRAQAEVFSVGHREGAEDYRPMSVIIDDVNEEIEAASARSAEEMNGVPTGFRDFDALFHGLKGGQFILIAARPAVGKSTLGLDVARAAALRHAMTTLVFSYEMSSTEIGTRALSAEAQINLSSLRTGRLSDHEWSKIGGVMPRLTNDCLFVDDSPNMTIAEIRTKARRLKQSHNLRLIVIDYLQLMTSGKKVESRQQEVSEFSRGLKLLAKELDVPVIALSQLKRGAEQRTDKTPQMSDLRESGSLEQDADIVILLHRPDMYDKDSPRAGEADAIVAKHRNGPTRTIALAFQGHYSRFADMAEEF